MTAYIHRAGMSRPRVLRLGVVVVALALMTFGVMHALAVAPGNPAFERTWSRTDKPVADGVVQRTWMWGPSANTSVIQEDYAESPGGKRSVQYYDKARMEINNPNATQDDLWYVTNGLLVRELITGEMQVGDSTFQEHDPAIGINVAGDPDDLGSPTYGTFTSLLSAAPLAEGSAITWRLAQNGTVTNDASLASYGVTAAQRVTVPSIDHQIASVFWDFMNSTDMVYEDGDFTSANLFQNPYYATGYPLTEAYWANVKVAGTDKDVLMQCFERRCLTYTPDNEAGWQVEAGNVGQHYFRWRYQGNPTPTPTPSPTPPPTETPTPVVADQLFVAHLSGDQEVPAVDTDASGTAYFYIHGDGSAIDYQITVNDIENVTMAHIHTGAVGEDGDVLVPLYDGHGTSVTLDGVLVEDTLTADDLPDDMTIADFAEDLTNGDYYVNVHTTANPDGEIRGQVEELPDTAFNASLSGAQENPPTDSTVTGTAFFLYHQDSGFVDFQLNAPDIKNATMAHIHEGKPNENGSVVALLFGASAPVNGITANGTLTQNDLQDMELPNVVYLMLTGNAYVNVHTSAHPDGEIRGQVRIGVGAHGTYLATLTGADEVPPTQSGATGYAVVTWNDDGSLSYMLMVTGLDGATAAHIHHGAPGANGDVVVPLFMQSDTSPEVDNGVLAEGTVNANDPALVNLAYWIATGDTYVNVHTVDHPDGDIRGQLTLAPGDVFVAELSGAAEVGYPTEEPVDTNGSGAAIFWSNADDSVLSYVLIVANIDDIQQASIQIGAADENGEVVVRLFTSDPATGVTNGILAQGTIENDDLETLLASSTVADLVDEMANSHVYVNVHTLDYPEGEIRGQIGPLS